MKLNLVFATIFAAGLAVGCGEDSVSNPDTTPTGCTGGKCDGQEEKVNLLSGLYIMDRWSLEGEEEWFFVYGVVAEEFNADIQEGHPLKIEIWASDGASNPEFVLESEFSYAERSRPPAGAPQGSERYRGDFLSEDTDVSELLPYQALRIAVSGEYDGKKVDQIFEFLGDSTVGELIVEEPGPAEVDPFAEAYDVEKALIYIDEDFTAPTYAYPPSLGPFGLAGTEFWQKWEGGHNPTYSYSAGTNAGQKCMYASAIRFQAIMEDPPESMVELVETTNWSGRFFNWNDDFSHERSTQRARGGALWAWRTSLIKWISQTGKDGACHLPTRSLVERAATACLRTGNANEGEIQNCQAQ